MRNFKASWKFLGGTIAFGLFCASLGGAYAHTSIHGVSNNGGTFLDLKTKFSDDDYYYNREFQKMRYLTELPGTGKKTETNGYLLADLGVRETNLKAGDFHKKAPHFKYY